MVTIVFSKSGAQSESAYQVKCPGVKASQLLYVSVK